MVLPYRRESARPYIAPAQFAQSLRPCRERPKRLRRFGPRTPSTTGTTPCSRYGDGNSAGSSSFHAFAPRDHAAGDRRCTGMHVAPCADMPAKQLVFRGDARAKLLRGATALADAVRITLGPRSKSVLI